MKKLIAIRLCLITAICVSWSPDSKAREPRALTFRLEYADQVSKEPFNGRVYVIFSRTPITEPPTDPSWFDPPPMFARDVKGWRSGDPLVLGDDCLNYPCPPSQCKAGVYFAMAVMDFDRGSRSFAAAAGNGYSRALRIDLDPMRGGSYSFSIDQVHREKPFRQTDRVKLVEMESKLLSSFHHRRVSMRAAVILPPSFAESSGKRYPVIFAIPGFGGTHYGALWWATRDVTNIAGTEMLYVVLDPSCRLGHHVFADSDNNGPCGQALVEELIPEIERRYRAIGAPWARFLTGHSSGGWSSLWLQVTYPDFFGGVWSTSPDPVDFRDFQQINLYEQGVNMFADAKGQKRPLARRGNTPVIYFKAFSDMEAVTGHGGQLGSFEAVFSPRGQDGNPLLLWDRTTGKVDTSVARSWKRYDIRLVIERTWPTLGPKLAGKIHVYTGGLDTFYLEGAVRLLKESLARLGGDAVIEIIPGKDHGSILDSSLRQRIAREMAAQARRAEPVPAN